MTEKLIAFAFIFWLAFAACSAQGQEPPATPAPPPTPVEKTTTAAAYTDYDVHATREKLREVLHRLPPEVGRVLKIDKSLWSNPDYLNAFPPLSAFVAAHPEVARNPEFYVRGLWIPLADEAPPDSASMRMWRQLMEGFFVLFGITATIFVFTWLIKRVIEHRRWSRLARVQADVHNKLLDRFQSNEEVLRYIETSAGRKFLEAAPIPLDAEPRAVSAPIGRVLWSVQAGIILGALGIGLQIVSGDVDKEVASALGSLGILAMALGAGFVVAAAISYLLSRRLGVLQPPPALTNASE